MDYAGVFWLTGGVLALLVLLLRAGTGANWLSFPMFGLLAMTVLFTAAFLRQERRAPDPMLPLSLFRHPIIAVATVGNVLIGLMMYAVDTYMPLFMQGVRGGSAHSAGVVLTPLVLMWSISAYFGARALLRFGLQKCTLFGLSCITASALALPFFTVSTPTWIIILTMAVLGSGLGPCSITFLASAQNAVPWNQRGVVTASSQFFRTMSGTIGVGALGAVLNGQMAPALAKLPDAHLGPNVLLNPEARANIPPGVLVTMQQALAIGLHWVFLLMAFAALTAFILVTRLARDLALLDTTASASSEPHPVSAPEPALMD
jgi:MFS family permease